MSAAADKLAEALRRIDTAAQAAIGLPVTEIEDRLVRISEAANKSLAAYEAEKEIIDSPETGYPSRTIDGRHVPCAHDGRVTEKAQPAPEPVQQAEEPLLSGFDDWWEKHRIKRLLNPAGVARVVWEASARHHRKSVLGAMDSTSGFYPEDEGSIPSGQAIAAGRADAQPASDLRFDWSEYRQISDLPAVDEAIRALLDDQTEDNATCVVRAIVEATHDRIAAIREPGSEPSEQAILHALDMARCDAHKKGDRALYLAFGRRMWLQIEAMRAMPTQTKGP